MDGWMDDLMARMMERIFEGLGDQNGWRWYLGGFICFVPLVAEEGGHLSTCLGAELGSGERPVGRGTDLFDLNERIK